MHFFSLVSVLFILLQPHGATPPKYVKAPTPKQSSALNTKLFVAVRDANLTLIKVLVAQGADVNARDGTRQTTLYVAVHNNAVEITEYLLNHGAKPNTAGPNRTYPIHLAAYAGNLELVSLLLKHGASANVQQDLGRTPLFLAREQEHRDVEQYLVAHGGVDQGPKEFVPTEDKPIFPKKPLSKRPDSPNMSVSPPNKEHVPPVPDETDVDTLTRGCLHAAKSIIDVQSSRLQTGDDMDVSTDIEKTNSLTSPYMGYVILTIRTSLRSGSERFVIRFTHQFAFQHRSWVYKGQSMERYWQ
jgi:hypothetical protein